MFVCGKGGVGRTTVATSLAMHFAASGQRVLIVQWALSDSISPRFGKPLCGHHAQTVCPNVDVMNFEPKETMEEYFVDHLKMKLLYHLVIENKHVQRLINAAPGLQELFFMGRIFWLTCLANTERGWSYDRIIVDAPASGHSASLFTLPQTIAQFGMTGPLASESERVAKMLCDRALTAVCLVTLPEELPMDETVEFAYQLGVALRCRPKAVFVNRSVAGVFEADDANAPWFASLLASNTEQAAVRQVFFADLLKRVQFETLLHARMPNDLLIRLPDVQIFKSKPSSKDVLQSLQAELSL